MSYNHKRCALRSKVLVPHKNFMNCLAEEDHHKRMYYLELQNNVLEDQKNKQCDRLKSIENNEEICDQFQQQQLNDDFEKQIQLDLKRKHQEEMREFYDKQVNHKNSIKQKQKDENILIRQKIDKENVNMFSGRGENNTVVAPIFRPLNRIGNGRVVRAHSEDKKTNIPDFCFASLDQRKVNTSYDAQKPYFPRYTRKNNENMDQHAHQPPLYSIKENPNTSRSVKKGKVELYQDLMNEQLQKNDQIQQLIMQEDAMINHKRKKNESRTISPEKSNLDLQNEPRNYTKKHRFDNYKSDNVFYENEQTHVPNTNLRKMIGERRNKFHVQGILNNDVVKPITVEQARQTQIVSRENQRYLTNHAKQIINGGGHLNRNLVNQSNMDSKELYNKIRQTYNKPSSFDIIAGT